MHKVCENSEVTGHQLHPDVKADVVHLWSDVRQAGRVRYTMKTERRRKRLQQQQTNSEVELRKEEWSLRRTSRTPSKAEVLTGCSLCLKLMLKRTATG